MQQLAGRLAGRRQNYERLATMSTDPPDNIHILECQGRARDEAIEMDALIKSIRKYIGGGI